MKFEDDINEEVEAELEQYAHGAPVEYKVEE